MPENQGALMSINPLKHLKTIIIYMLYLVIASVLIIYGVFWLPFLIKIHSHEPASYYQMPKIRHVTQELMQQTGSIFTGKNSSFIHFEETPDAGVIRVCALGDSFTYGEEVSEGIDYPSHLQALFKRHGYHNVEVLNFGNNWHGFHQTYTIWKGLAKNMDCQFVLLGPHTFFSDRDSRLNHTMDKEPYYLHSLYILEKEGSLKRIDIHGTTPEERIADYYSFIPKPRFIQYDNQMPPLIRAVMSTIAPGKEVKNPWYYSKDYESSLHKTWKMQIDSMASESRQLVVFHYWGLASNIALTINRENIAIASPELYSGFPYRMAGRHNSGWGNYLLAQQYFSALTNNLDYKTTIIRPIPIQKHSNSPETGTALSIQEISSLGIKINDITVGSFIYTHPMSLRKFDPDKSDAKAIIFITPDGESPLHGVALLLNRPISDGSEAALRINNKSSYPLNSLYRISSNLPLYILELPYSSITSDDLLLIEAEKWDSANEIISNLQLTINGEAILDSSPYGNAFRLTPIDGQFIRAVADRNAFINPDDLPETGDIYIEAIDTQGRTTKTPISRWEKIDHPLPVMLKSNIHPIHKTL